MAGKGFFGALVDIFADAVSDIRHKAVEEGWFNRQATDTWPTVEAPTIESPKIGPDDAQQGFDAQWAIRQPVPAKDERDREIGERGIDL